MFLTVTNTSNVTVPFSDEDKALIKILYQFKGYGSRRLLTDFPKINWNKRAFNSFTEIGSGDRKRRHRAHEWQTQSTRVLKRT